MGFLAEISDPRKMLNTHYICFQKECFRRGLDASRLFNYLDANGRKPAGQLSKADLIVIFTCGGFDIYEQRCIKTIKRALSQKKPDAKIIVSGCLLKINPGPIEAFGGITMMAVTELHMLNDLIEADILYADIPEATALAKIADIDDYSKLHKLIQRFRFSKHFVRSLFHLVQKKLAKFRKSRRALSSGIFKIKVAEGCLGECTYCAIKLASGELASKPLEEVLKEFRHGLDHGYKRFEFVSLDLGCYGLDIETDVASLLQTVFDEKQDFKLIINDLNVQWLIRNERLLPVLIENRNRIEHIKIPIQSGSNKILKRMNRFYTIEEVHTVLNKIRQRMPDTNIHTHFLIGFPGEKEEDFLATSRLLDDFGFDKIDVFCYQDRPGVKSSGFSDKIDNDEIVRRAQMLASKKKCVDITY